MAKISIVVPVYGCAKCLPPLHERLKHVLRPLTDDYEIIFVEDRSPDDSWRVITELVKKDSCTRGLRLSRNFGQQAAITAGLAESSGEWAVVMDCDLQDPPEEIPRLYQTASDGYDLVLARRQSRQHSAFRKLAAKLYFRLISFFTGDRMDGAYGSFSIISRKVISAYLRLQDRDRHYLFILHWLGFNAASIDYVHQSRFSGKSTYTLRMLVRHALDGLFFQTTILLKWIVYLGFWVSVLGVALAAYFIYQYFVHSVYPGWTSLSVLILLVGGFIIISTGIAGLYIGKIFEQAKGRPLFVVDEKIVHDTKQ